jgi:hypothetical protein
MLVFCLGPIKAPKAKTDANRGKQNLRKQQNRRQQQAGALIGVKGKKS